MIQFNSHEEIKDVYDSGKYNIFYEKDHMRYEVRHIGSTIYCHNTEKHMGMGAVHNFPIEFFYGEEKPIIVEHESEITEKTNEKEQEILPTEET